MRVILIVIDIYFAPLPSFRQVQGLQLILVVLEVPVNAQSSVNIFHLYTLPCLLVLLDFQGFQVVHDNLLDPDTR